MPITINDCGKCGRRAVVESSEFGNDFNISCVEAGTWNCDNEVQSHMEFDIAVERWNEINKEKNNADNDK